jgi:type VI protein secretion system component Hcp
MKVRGVLLGAICVLSCLVVSGRAQAQQIFLEITGVQGEATTPGFEGQIEVLSVSSGGSKVCGTGTLNMSSLNLLKRTDRSSVDFAGFLKNGTVIPSATVRFTRTDNQVYQSYVLTNARVEAFQMSGSAGGDPRTTESLSLYFSQVTITYTYFDGSGKGSGTESETLTSAPCP